MYINKQMNCVFFKRKSLLYILSSLDTIESITGNVVKSFSVIYDRISLMKSKANPLKPRKSLNKTILVLIVLIIFVTILLLIFSMSSGKKSSVAYKTLGSNQLSAQSHRRFSIESSQDQIYNIGDYTVNLDRNRMLILNISIKCEKESFETLVDYNVIVQNAVLEAFSDQSKLRMATTNKGKERIKKDIESNINMSLHQPIVKEVYFTKYIIQ